MKYSFEIYKFFDDRDNRNKERPLLKIENQEQYGFFFLDEIANLRIDYVIEIAESLEKVIQNEAEQFDFGYELYSIDCKKDVATVIDISDNWKPITEIPTQEVYELMRDWRDYILKWEKEQE